MKAKKISSIEHVFVFYLFCLGVFFLIYGICNADESKYPVKIEIINKGQAKYDTPENSLVANLSALINGNMEWYYETLTMKSAEEDKKEYRESNIDPKKKTEAVKNIKEAYIIGKQVYRHAILLIVESHHKDGSIMRGASTYVKENGLWKTTFEFSSDEKLWDYLDYIKPEEIISSAITIYPDSWNLNWYQWIKDHMEEKKWIQYVAKRVSILCLITSLKDNEGKSYSVTEIDPETILLNYLLHPQPWRVNREEKIAFIVQSRENRHFNKRKGFKEWQNSSGLKYKSPVMLVKFNKFKAMETLPEMSLGKEYEIILSGELKNGKPFKGTTKIRVTGWHVKHQWKWNHPDWLNSEKDIDNWWNKENDFEDWWEKTIKKHKRQNNRKEKDDSHS